MPKSHRGSILAIDFGSVNTRALLFDVVDGVYRLVAQGRGRTTIDFPNDDVFVGLGHILDDMAVATGRQFFDELGRLVKPEQSDRYGVDYCITTTSAGDSLRVVLVGLLPNISIAPALRAISSFYMQPVAAIHLEDGRDDEERIHEMASSLPDLIFISGGTDGGARTPMLAWLSLVKQAVALMPVANRPTILYAGNRDLADHARQLLGQLAEVIAAPNIRPTAAGGALAPAQLALAQIYSDYKKRRGFSFHHVAAMSDSGILPTVHGFEKMTAFFARTIGGDVISMDVGSARTLLSMSVGGQVKTLIYNDIGMGHSAAALLERVGEDAAAEWLPFYPKPGELAKYARGKGLRLEALPLGIRERYIEYALLRAGLRSALAEADGKQEVDLIVMAGATLTGSAYRALDMLLLADALQPVGVVQVKADQRGALAALGALALTEPVAVVQLLASDVIEHLGAVVSASGQAAAGSRAMKLQLMEAGSRIDRDVEVGEVWHYAPASPEAEVEVRIQTGRGFRIGGKRRLRLRLRGGTAGLLFDARGRPLSMGASLAERVANMSRWFAAVTGQEGTVMIPESWFADSPD